MTGDMRNISFLMSDGNETPLRAIKVGTAEIYSSDENELKFLYRRHRNIQSKFSLIHHTDPSDSSSTTSKDSINLTPTDQHRLFLADPAFILSFDIERFPDGGVVQIQNGFFAHFLSPEGLVKLPVHTVFVLDISGSMDELGKLINLKSAMKIILKSLKEEDSFEVFVFSTNVKSLGKYSGARSDINRSISKINSLRAYGGTNINDALLDSVYSAKDYKLKQGVKQIVFLTDGNRTVGELDAFTIRKGVKEANTVRLPIYALAFGNDADMKFLRQMSGENRGFVRKIRSEGRPTDQLKDFYDEISTPLLTGLSVHYPEDQVQKNSVVKPNQDSFYSGDEVILAGKLTANSTKVTPKVEANGKDGRIQLKISKTDLLEAPQKERTGVIEKIWAYLAVQDLLSAQELIDDENIRAELRARALEIAIAYNFVTSLTSLIINPLKVHEKNGRLEFESFPLDIPSSLQDEMIKGLTLVSPEDFAATLPNELQGSISPSQNRRFSFVDNDPHFVVQVDGLPLPLCFDLHGQPGDVLSLVRDSVSDLIVNAEVSAAAGRPGATYFTKLFISLPRINLTISTDNITVNCFRGNKFNEVSEIWHDTDYNEPTHKRRIRRRKKFNRQLERVYGKKKRKRSRRSASFHKFRHNHCLFCDYPDDGDYLEQNIREYRNTYSPVIDAYLEKNSESEILPQEQTLNHKQIKIRPSFGYMNKSSDAYKDYIEELHRNGYVNHFLYRHSTNNGNSFIIRSSISIVPPKHPSKADEPNIPNECNKEFSWEHFAQRRYDDIVLNTRGRRKRKRLDIIVSDVKLHVVITNTRNRHGQAFLGFYMQEQKILSRNTTGVIGQFVFKSVKIIGNNSNLLNEPHLQENKEVPLRIIHHQYLPPTNITALVSKRRSLLHRERVLCLHVRRHGKGLLSKRPKDYLLPSLFS
ncbi:UNVERIFIED_CONTAM: hypothetical protein RMT77_007524 [Armadillidium vulgare]